MDDLCAAPHSITDGRMTAKKPLVAFLKKPKHVIKTFGPGNSVLLHNPEDYEALMERLLGDAQGTLDADQYFVAKRLENVAEVAPLDEQGRLRLSQVFLDRLGIKEKSARIYVVPAKRDGWLELYSEDEFKTTFDTAKDEWREALDRLILKWRARQTE